MVQTAEAICLRCSEKKPSENISKILIKRSPTKYNFLQRLRLIIQSIYEIVLRRESFPRMTPKLSRTTFLENIYNGLFLQLQVTHKELDKRGLLLQYRLSKHRLYNPRHEYPQSQPRKKCLIICIVIL